MKQGPSFFTSLEKYSRKLVARSPLPYSWLVVSFGLVVLLSSLFGSNLASARSREQAIQMAAERGDYTIAQTLFEQMQDSEIKNQVLGAEVELEDIVYPERRVERRIAELEQKLAEYPGNREIYLMLGNLYGQLGNQEMSEQYQEKARILDPND